MPSCRAARTLAWPAIRPPSSPTSAGVVHPHSLMLAAIAATWASVWVRAFLAYGISRSIPHRSTLSAGHGLSFPAVSRARARARVEGGEVLALLPAGRPAPGRAPPRAIDYSCGLILFKAPGLIIGQD